MTQEIEINLTLTLEVEITQSRKSILEFISDMMINVINTKSFSLQKYAVNRIAEEAEIYAPETDHLGDVWAFIEKFYPKYHSCAEIMRNDDLCKITNGELNGDAAELFHSEFNRDHELAVIAFDQSNKYVYKRAIMGYLNSQKDTISISWGVEVVEQRATENGYLLGEGEALTVLHLLKEKHDCNLGITWDTIDDYLSSLVPETDMGDGLNWETTPFEGKEYQCRTIKDLHDTDFELLIAPIMLSDALKLDANGNGNAAAVLLDQQIAYYANEQEMLLGDKELFGAQAPF